MRPASRLELCQELPHVALHRLLREEEPNADLAVHEAVRNQLENLDLAGRRLLLQLVERRLKRDHLGDAGIAPGGHGLEAGRVLAVPRQDLVALDGVHDWAIGLQTVSL